MCLTVFFLENIYLDVLEEVTFSPGDYILREGDVGDAFYIIFSGEVSITQNATLDKRGDESPGRDRGRRRASSTELVRRYACKWRSRTVVLNFVAVVERHCNLPLLATCLNAVEVIGEGSLLTNAPRNANAVAVGEVGRSSSL